MFIYNSYLRENYLGEKTRGKSLIILTCKYRLINHINEYWYMGSMLAKSEMVKNRMEECLATWKVMMRKEQRLE